MSGSGSFNVDRGSQGPRFESLDTTALTKRLSQRLSATFGRVAQLVGDNPPTVQTVLKQSPATAKKGITDTRAFSNITNLGAKVKAVFTKTPRIDSSAQKPEASPAPPAENPILHEVEKLPDVVPQYLDEHMQTLCTTYKDDLATLTPLEKLKILKFVQNNPALLQHSSAAQLLEAVVGHAVEDLDKEIEALKSTPNPDKALSKEQLVAKTKQLLATTTNPAAALEKAIGPKAAGLAALLAEIRKSPSDSNFQALHEHLRDAMAGGAGDSQEIQNLRDAYVAVLSRAIGGPTAAKYVAFEFKSEVDKIIGDKLSFQERFRGGSVAASLYRGIMKSEMPALQANSALMKSCIKTANGRADTSKKSADVLNQVATAFQKEMPPHVRILNTMMFDSFKEMFAAKMPKKDASEEAEKQIISMTFLRLIVPTMLSDKNERVTDTVKPLQSAATYSAGVRGDAIAAGLVTNFKQFAKFLSGQE